MPFARNTGRERVRTSSWLCLETPSASRPPPPPVPGLLEPQSQEGCPCLLPGKSPPNPAKAALSSPSPGCCRLSPAPTSSTVLGTASGIPPGQEPWGTQVAREVGRSADVCWEFTIHPRTCCPSIHPRISPPPPTQPSVHPFTRAPPHPSIRPSIQHLLMLPWSWALELGPRGVPV